MKRAVFLILTFIFINPFFTVISAQPQRLPWWLSLEMGKVDFRNGNYGEALMLFEDARRDRRAMYEQMERDLIHLLSVNEVRRLGDSLEWVERYSSERLYYSATAALQELYYRVPKESLNNSALAALEAIGRLKDYPEAEYWIGEVYRVEGELTLALSQYRKAYSLRALFEDSGFAVTLQYKISGILRTMQEYNEMERILHSIINDLDSFWQNSSRADANGDGTPVPYAQASASFASQAMTRTLENEGISRFLEMHRYNNGIVEEAHRLLGLYYAASGRPSAQPHLMYAFLIQNTIIIDEIKRRRFDYAFTSLSALAEEINKNPVLLAYINEVEYYKTSYYLAASLHRNGRLAVARNIWEFLASVPAAGEWSRRSFNQLREPRLEPTVEMP